MKIGLTGGIGSGKSTVSGFWIEAGATVIDTDAISRRLTAAGGAAMPFIAAEFGTNVLAADGSLDRDGMRKLAFSDPGVRRRLEAILHPMIGAQTQAEAAAARSTTLVFDVPLLVESGRWRARVDRVLVIDCEEATQLSRVLQRPGWTQESAEAVLRQQVSRHQRRASADAVIHNEGLSLGELQTQVLTLAARWHAMS